MRLPAARIGMFEPQSLENDRAHSARGRVISRALFEHIALRCLACVACIATWFLVGCASLPKGATAVDAVSIDGTDKVSSGDVEGAIATIPSPKFLFLFRGVVFDYELLDRYVLERDLARVERFYRARGFYEAHVRAGRVERTSENHVKVNVEVEEGLPVVVRQVTLSGLDGVPPEVVKAANKAAKKGLKRDKIFDEDDFTKTDDAISRALTDNGFAYAKTTRRAEVDLPNHAVDVYYDVFPGPPSVFGPIKIEGLGSLPEEPIRRALDIKEGTPFSTLEIQNAQQAVLDLGAFSSVVLVPELPDPPPPSAVVPITVKLEEAKLHQVTLGGGFEFDPIKTDLHLISGWEDRNFLGGFRHFTIKFTPGVVLYPTRFETPLQAPTDYLPEEKLKLELRQPGFIEARTGGVLTSEVNTYPLLLTPQQAQAGPPVLGYFEYKGAVAVDRTWWKFYAKPSYNFQHNIPFAYPGLGPKEDALSPITISFVELLTELDFRNDRIHPHKGLYLQNDLQFAGLGGDARDIREQPEVRGYIPIGKKITFALRATVGFLFPSSYEHASEIPASDRPRQDRDAQLGLLRGFFSGGPSSNRGYPLRGVGPHGIIPFFNPATASAQIAKDCAPGAPGSDDPKCTLPIGGFTLWEASAEVRFPISGPLSAATFFDTSNVSAKVADFQFRNQGSLHASCGFGIRYDTPVGPIRLDLGYRIPGLNPDFNDPAVKAVEGDPATLLGLPVAIAFGIGEAF